MNAARKIEANKPAQDSTEHRIYLGLGSNIAPETNLPHAVALLCELVQVEYVSSVWETRAVGSDGPNFLNAALTARTHLSAQAVKETVIDPVERQLGRRRTADKNAPRTIDIDLLVYDEQILNQQVWSQAFAAVPLAELISDLVHLSNGETLAQAAARLASGIFIQRHPEIHLGRS